MSNPNYNAVPIATSSGFTCGYVRGIRFDRKFDPTKHIIREPVPALALEEFVIEQLTRAGVETIRFFTAEGVEYKCSLLHFLEAGEAYKPAGWPAQRKLPLTGFMQRRSREAVQLAMSLGVEV